MLCGNSWQYHVGGNGKKDIGDFQTINSNGFDILRPPNIL
jgi:hypothetical protein